MFQMFSHELIFHNGKQEETHNDKFQPTKYPISFLWPGHTWLQLLSILCIATKLAISLCMLAFNMGFRFSEATLNGSDIVAENFTNILTRPAITFFGEYICDLLRRHFEYFCFAFIIVININSMCWHF